MPQFKGEKKVITTKNLNLALKKHNRNRHHLQLQCNSVSSSFRHAFQALSQLLHDVISINYIISPPSFWLLPPHWLSKFLQTWGRDVFIWMCSLPSLSQWPRHPSEVSLGPLISNLYPLLKLVGPTIEASYTVPTFFSLFILILCLFHSS